MTSRTAKTVVVLAATAALSGIGAGLAAADSPAPSSTSTSTTEYTVDGLSQYIRPWELINIPTMLCGPGGYLQDREYSPGRMVPRGVQVTEPGGVAVIIRNPVYGPVDPTGSFRPAIGSDGSIASATNWMMTTGWLQITLHCTTDINHAVKEPAIP